MPNPRNTKPNAQNRQHTRGACVPTTIRYYPLDLVMLDALVSEYQDRTGEPTNRSDYLRHLIRREYRERVSETEPSLPKGAGKVAKGKRKK